MIKIAFIISIYGVSHKHKPTIKQELMSKVAKNRIHLHGLMVIQNGKKFNRYPPKKFHEELKSWPGFERPCKSKRLNFVLSLTSDKTGYSPMSTNAERGTNQHKLGPGMDFFVSPFPALAISWGMGHV
jgi:hypothetical protein